MSYALIDRAQREIRALVPEFTFVRRLDQSVNMSLAWMAGYLTAVKGKRQVSPYDCRELATEWHRGYTEAVKPPPVTLDRKKANRLRDEAIARAKDGASAEWRQAALAAVEWVAKRKTRFTSDDVWVRLDAEGVERPHEPRALGPIMQQARRDGTIQPTPDFERSDRPESHRNPKRVYESLIRKGTAAMF